MDGNKVGEEKQEAQMCPELLVNLTRSLSTIQTASITRYKIADYFMINVNPLPIPPWLHDSVLRINSKNYYQTWCTIPEPGGTICRFLNAFDPH